MVNLSDTLIYILCGELRRGERFISVMVKIYCPGSNSLSFQIAPIFTTSHNQWTRKLATRGSHICEQLQLQFLTSHTKCTIASIWLERKGELRKGESFVSVMVKIYCPGSNSLSSICECKTAKLRAWTPDQTKKQTNKQKQSYSFL